MQRARAAHAVSILVGTLVLVAVSATTAFAKGTMTPTNASVVITGPGLSEPIDERWEGSCFLLDRTACSPQTGTYPEAQGFPADLGQVHGAIWKLGADSNFFAQTAGAGGAAKAPGNASALGPRYHVTWVVTMGGATDVIEQDLYPYGPPVAAGLPRVPWLYTARDQTLSGQTVGWGWMPTLRTYLDELVAFGLPATRPPVEPPPGPPAHLPAHPAAQAAAPAPAPVSAWPLVAGAGLLIVIVAIAAVIGRPKRHAVTT